MLQEKMMHLNSIQTHLQKIKDLISFYETQAKASHDPVCGSFLKNVADKKSIQLIIIERILRKRGIELPPLERSDKRKNMFPALTLSERSLEDIFNFVSKLSLNYLKSFCFLSMEIKTIVPIFKAMFELEEDFLIFIEGDYLHHLSESTLKAGFQQSQQENTFLSSAG